MTKFRKFFVLLCGVLTAVFVLCGTAFAETEDSWLLGDDSGKPPAADSYDEFADLVLNAIITDDMTDMEKCRAIYDYVHEIPYVNVVYSEDWRENGYHMLFDRAGDCFGYYSASRLLLERLGYQVVELQNMNGFTHVWCLVSIDDGQTWQHFDPTCWSWGSDGYLCMVSDDELVAYGTKHQVGYGQLSHDWDRQLAATEIEAIQSAHKSRYVQFITDYEEEPETRRIYLLYPEDESVSQAMEYAPAEAPEAVPEDAQEYAPAEFAEGVSEDAQEYVPAEFAEGVLENASEGVTDEEAETSLDVSYAADDTVVSRRSSAQADDPENVQG